MVVDTSYVHWRWLGLWRRQVIFNCCILFVDSGKLMTAATWIRKFVTSHPDYKHDSVVSDQINFDLINACADITYNDLACPDLLLQHSTKTNEQIPSAMRNADEHLANMAAKFGNASDNRSWWPTLESSNWHFQIVDFHTGCYLGFFFVTLFVGQQWFQVRTW